jgi:hypothetical protein
VHVVPLQLSYAVNFALETPAQLFAHVSAAAPVIVL